METERLVLREFVLDDAEFILGLLNQPSFIRHIGDKGVRTLDGARRYILDGPVDSYRRHGFGLYLVEAKASGVPVGMCGLVKRETLEDADIGFAFVPEHWSQGYAVESATAVMAHARDTLGLERVIAIVSPGNEASIKLLEKLGMRFERKIRMPGEEVDIKLFS